MDLSTKIRDYISERQTVKMEALEKELVKAEKEKNRVDFASFRLQWQERQQELAAKFQPADWLTDAAKRANQISLVSHALKYTHSDAKGTSVLQSHNLEPAGHRFLSSSSCDRLPADVVGNAAALDVANLLRLEADGTSLLQLVEQNNSVALAPFGSRSQQALWLEGFREALKVSTPASHTLAKQLYFPLTSARFDYHLLAPLSATSLHQEVFERVQNSRFSDEAKAARDAKRKGYYWSQASREYPNLAIQTYGGTKPQNISLLNSQRKGRVYLFDARPPKWRPQNQPPKSVTAFWAAYQRRIRAQCKELREFLEWASLRQLNNLHVRQKRAGMVAELVDEFHQYSGAIQRLPAGWSAAPFGMAPEACWLDPARDDPAFVALRDDKAWCKVLALSFGRVLARATSSKKLIMADDEVAHYQQQLRREMYRLMNDLEEFA